MSTPTPLSRIAYSSGYSTDVDKIREQEYPHLASKFIRVFEVNKLKVDKPY
jgi:hypothetical protein